MLQIGDTAPDFSLPNADMEMLTLSCLRGKTVALIFYPKDDTPSSALEAIEFSDLEEDFNKLRTVVIGISPDDCIKHADFRDKHGLSIQLLSDEDGKVSSMYGVLQEVIYGDGLKMSILRSTFVICPEGKIRLCQQGSSSKGHAKQILNFIQTIQ